MKRIVVLILILSLLIGYIPRISCATEEDQGSETTQDTTQMNSAVNSGSHSLDALNPMIGTGKISKNIKSAIAYEANSKTLLYSWDPDTPRYPASFVKILTALIAVENGSLDAAVVVKDSALEGLPIDAMTSELVVGEVISLSDLVHLLLIDSGNDAANVIAEHIAGSQGAFVQMMNDYAKGIGCTASNFTNASGLHDDNQHTTARDAARILDAAMKNEGFRTIFTKYDYTVPATNKSLERRLMSGSSIQNPESKLYYDNRVIGSRTGVTNDGRRSLASVAESNGMMVITIVMGAESVYQEDGYSAISIGGYQETTMLLDACLSGYKTAEILSEGQAMRQIAIEGAGNHLVMGPKESVSSVLPEGVTIDSLTFRYEDIPLTLPVEKDQPVSNVSIWNGNMCIGQAQLYAMNRVYSASSVVQQDMTDGENRKSGWITVLVIVSILAFGYVILRFSGNIRYILLKQKRKRRRRNRKRVRE